MDDKNGLNTWLRERNTPEMHFIDGKKYGRNEHVCTLHTLQDMQIYA